MLCGPTYTLFSIFHIIVLDPSLSIQAVDISKRRPRMDTFNWLKSSVGAAFSAFTSVKAENSHRLACGLPSLRALQLLVSAPGGGRALWGRVHRWGSEQHPGKASSTVRSLQSPSTQTGKNVEICCSNTQRQEKRKKDKKGNNRRRFGRRQHSWGR